jgi:hypothetical protein
VALLHSDSVRLCALADGTAWPLGTLSGRAAIGRLVAELSRLPAGGGTDLAGSLRAGRPAMASGPTVLLSDLLAPADVEALALLGPEGAVAHVTDPADADPLAGGPAGALEIRDSETGEVVNVTGALRARYADRWRAHRATLAARCAAAGLRYIPADTTTPVADILFGPAGPSARSQAGGKPAQLPAAGAPFLHMGALAAEGGVVAMTGADPHGLGNAPLLKGAGDGDTAGSRHGGSWRVRVIREVPE